MSGDLIEQFEQHVVDTAHYPSIGNNLAYPALGLTGESGEVANQVKKVYRDDNGVLTSNRRSAIIDELSDVLWYVVAVAQELDCSLEEIIRYNIRKINERQGKVGSSEVG